VIVKRIVVRRIVGEGPAAGAWPRSPRPSGRMTAAAARPGRRPPAQPRPPPLPHDRARLDPPAPRRTPRRCPAARRHVRRDLPSARNRRPPHRHRLRRTRRSRSSCMRSATMLRRSTSGSASSRWPTSRASGAIRRVRVGSFHGGGGIRTRGPGLPDSGFQDRCIRPLCHRSARQRRRRRCSTPRGLSPALCTIGGAIRRGAGVWSIGPPC
jgi:hypothetical protein